MAITSVTLNGQLAALHDALEQLVPGFFASVEYDAEESPTAVLCKDGDGNTLFKVERNSSGAKYTVYKDAETYVEASLNTSYMNFKYFYKVGNNGGVIVTSNGANFVVIAKTNTGGVGFAMNHASTGTNKPYQAVIGCWGDDTEQTSELYITGSGTSYTIGNYCQFVPVPMHGTIAEALYLPRAYYLPMAQDAMRGVVQQITGDSGVYLTNGYLALLDDGGAA